jgi:hypothetical protein
MISLTSCRLVAGTEGDCGAAEVIEDEMLGPWKRLYPSKDCFEFQRLYHSQVSIQPIKACPA